MFPTNLSDLINEKILLQQSIDSLQDILKINQDESAQKEKQMEATYSDNLEKVRQAYDKIAQDQGEKY